MTSPELDESLQKSSGRAPLFPLPNVVHFPNVLLPLHIFEPRYREMVSDALAADRLLCMALLQPGWESTIDTKTARIFPVVCVGRITAEQRLADGRFFLLLQGLARARVIEEESSELPYRVARIELLPDIYASPAVIDRERRRRELLAAFRDLFPDVDLDPLLHEAVAAAAPLGQVCDVIAYAMRLEPFESQELLSALDVDQRSDLLLERLRSEADRRRRIGEGSAFPPPFSQN